MTPCIGNDSFCPCHDGDACHYVIYPWDDPEDMISGRGTTICRQTGNYMMPGIFSRMGLKRCPKCCRSLGIPRGDCAPFNALLGNDADV